LGSFVENVLSPQISFLRKSKNGGDVMEFE
jgi:hypothetical protein